MNLTKQNVINTFAGAREQGSKFVFVSIDAEGISEVIAVPQASFDAKEKFYMGAYKDDLTHVMNSKVKIVGLNHGDSDSLDDVIYLDKLGDV